MSPQPVCRLYPVVVIVVVVAVVVRRLVVVDVVDHPAIVGHGRCRFVVFGETVDIVPWHFLEIRCILSISRNLPLKLIVSHVCAKGATNMVTNFTHGSNVKKKMERERKKADPLSRCIQLIEKERKIRRRTGDASSPV